jgi:DNA-binding ferritin-like protein (Dps family)
LGDDIKGLCSALSGEEEAKSYRDKWREQLNSNIAKKLVLQRRFILLRRFKD